ncbi:protein phosphatase regulator [Coniothyrium glycines]
MTRPHIIRADTLDLQDKTSPTAQDHSQQPEHPAPLGIGPAAPHQQAAIRHVEEERHSEEARLQNAWSNAGSALAAEPAADHDRSTVTTTADHDRTTVASTAAAQTAAQQQQQHDEQAVRRDGDDADLQDAHVDDDMDDDMMDKISSSPSIDDEDIDFEFVYALHTFVATVEGQANATKGDTMVLLDDSNSYWWLVRVVKDSSIGYLPAEHIETPTERLARLNKHRNIDLSATMLGDTAEKSKNPLKKAMRRRNAKTVQFAPPTYVEASDYDYSSDEGDGELFGGPAPKQIQQQQQDDQQQTAQQSSADQEEGLKVQPLQIGGGTNQGQSENETRSSNGDASKRDDEKQRGSEEALDRPLDPKITRNGTLRNTDSFFKDENTETRKITLTPNLLRDDSSTSTTGSRERGPSLESLEKNGFGDKAKEDKKKKEKKSGMLSGLFKRKDKKSKGGSDSVDSDAERADESDRGSPQSKPLEELSERPSTEQTGPVRQSSKGKLQKSNRTRDDSPQQTKGILKTESPTEAAAPAETQPDATTSAATSQPASMRLVSPEQEAAVRPSAADGAAMQMSSRNPFSGAMKSQTNTDPKPEKVKQAKQRVQLDDFDSDDDSSDPFADPDAQPRPQTHEPGATGRLSESPVHVTAADAQPSNKGSVQEREQDAEPRHPPALTTDSSSQETSSPVSTPTLEESPMKTIPENTPMSSFHTDPESAPAHLALHSAAVPPPSRPAPIPDDKREPSPPVSSDSAILPVWSDASLRAYLDDGNDIRDMLVVVNDTTGVIPVGPEHPFMKSLFVEETKVMQNLSGELDRLLTGLMEKSMRRAGSGASKASTARSTSANGSLRAGGR